MARQQLPIVLNVGPVTTTPKQISLTQILMTSFIVQAPIGNSDYIKLGSSSGQFYEIAPGRDISVNGDNLDNGTTAYMNLQDWYIVSVSGSQDCNVVYLERF